MRLGAFRVIRTQIYVGQAPLEAIGNLRAQTIHLVVVSIDTHDTRAVDRGVEHLGGFQISWNKDARIETLLRSLSRDGVGEIAGRAAAHGLKTKTTARG